MLRSFKVSKIFSILHPEAMVFYRFQYDVTFIFNEKLLCASFPNFKAGSDNITCDHNGQLIRHPKDCHKFYECAYSIPRELTCPANLAWNDVIKTCDYVGHVAFCKQVESNNDSSDNTIKDLTGMRKGTCTLK